MAFQSLKYKVVFVSRGEGVFRFAFVLVVSKFNAVVQVIKNYE